MYIYIYICMYAGDADHIYIYIYMYIFIVDYIHVISHDTYNLVIYRNHKHHAPCSLGPTRQGQKHGGISG